MKEYVFLKMSRQDCLRDPVSSVRITRLQKYRATATRSITRIAIAHHEISFKIGERQNIKLIVWEWYFLRNDIFLRPDQIDSRALGRGGEQKAIVITIDQEPNSLIVHRGVKICLYESRMHHPMSIYDTCYEQVEDNNIIVRVIIHRIYVCILRSFSTLQISICRKREQGI